MGTPCSSFVTLCLAQSNRRAENGYRGDESRKFVREGNAQMMVASLLFMVSWWLGGLPVLEQPASSVLPLLQPLALVLKFVDAKRTNTWLGQFGAEASKPLQLWHCHPAYSQLRRRRPAGGLRSTLTCLVSKEG